MSSACPSARSVLSWLSVSSHLWALSPLTFSRGQHRSCISGSAIVSDKQTAAVKLSNTEICANAKLCHSVSSTLVIHTDQTFTTWSAYTPQICTIVIETIIPSIKKDCIEQGELSRDIMQYFDQSTCGRVGGGGHETCGCYTAKHKPKQHRKVVYRN